MMAGKVDGSSLRIHTRERGKNIKKKIERRGEKKESFVSDNRRVACSPSINQKLRRSDIALFNTANRISVLRAPQPSQC